MKKNKTPFNDLRVRKYSQAEKMFPSARENELKILDSLLEIKKSDIALEIGSGSGFLTRHLLKKGITVDTIDYSYKCIKGVRNHYQINAKNGFQSITNNQKYDLVISLASFHHIIESSSHLQNQLINDISRISRPGGKLLILDVPNRNDDILSNGDLASEAGKYTSNFFNSIVDRYSKPFHNGVYLNSASIVSQLEKYGWRCIIRKIVYCPWEFRTINDLNVFISTLFNIPNINSIKSYSTLLKKMIVKYQDKIELKWGLIAIFLKRL